MSTQATITLNNLERPIVMSVSHDGDPTKILDDLAVFFASEGEKDISLFRGIHTANPSVTSVCTGEAIDPTWEYEINDDNQLSCKWNSSSAKIPGHTCHPMDYLYIIEDYAIDENMVSMQESLNKLSQAGIDLSNQIESLPDGPGV